MNTTEDLDLLSMIRPHTNDVAAFTVSERSALLHRITKLDARIAVGHVRRRRSVAVTATAVLCTGVAVVAGSIVHQTHSGPAPRPAEADKTSAPTTPRQESALALDVAYVTQRTKAALATTTDYVEASSNTLAGADPKHPDLSRSWIAVQGDTIYIRERSTYSDHTDTESGLVLSSTQETVTTVRHDLRQWWVSTVTSPKIIKEHRRLMESSLLPQGPTPQSISDALNKGDYTLAGQVIYQGREVLKLTSRDRSSSDGSKTPWRSREELFIDPATYLPTHISELTVGPTGSEEKDLDADITWLAKTPENLSLVTVQPPSNYAHLPKDPSPPPHEDGHTHG